MLFRITLIHFPIFQSQINNHNWHMKISHLNIVFIHLFKIIKLRFNKSKWKRERKKKSKEMRLESVWLVVCNKESRNCLHCFVLFLSKKRKRKTTLELEFCVHPEYILNMENYSTIKIDLIIYGFILCLYFFILYCI